jgi:predicted CopG family antitoxin
MAKKTVAGYREKSEGRSFSKVIKMLKSPKTGAYIFKEEMVPNEAVKDYFQ